MIKYGHKRLREEFLAFFEKKEHSRVPSSSLIPKGDRSLLFTNAGMNQFKDFFLDIKPPPYARAVSCQKCLRAGGKHNDLDNVGYTARHHTFFEMLGNFSFGDYFKPIAIELAWEFITDILKIPEEKIYVSVYHEDDEACDIWAGNIGLNEGRIFRFGEKNNFWAMGDTGPCGPCSEIFYDLGDEFGPAEQDNEDRFLEIWNLVFMQYNRDNKGRLSLLKNRNIDTGMGLERTLSVLEGCGSNFESSLFVPLIKRIEEIFSRSYISDKSLECTAFRVIADHCRAIALLIADGQIPTNFSRGYVLRRIIRRAYRYGIILGASGTFLCSVIDAFIAEMSGVYPELMEKHKFIEEVVSREEENFQITLSKGIERINDTVNELKSKNISILEGALAFKMYDTYGIPLDIIADIARDNHIRFHESDFIECMEEQKNKARLSSHFKIDKKRYTMLNEMGLKTQFTGYEQNLSHTCEIKAIIQDGLVKNEAVRGQAFIITDKTPFYAEKGGQVGDKGIIIKIDSADEITVSDTVYLTDDCIGHKAIIEKPVRVGDKVILEVDWNNRKNIERNHTATHLLHYALSEVLGESAKQAGSLVDAERLRFDFSYHKQLTTHQVEKIEYLVHNAILQCFDVINEEMDYKSALESGAIALFTEKYENIVRVVRIGDFSIELCGGTHIQNTGEIGMLKIIQESAIASGIRRIEAITGHRLFYKVQEMYMLEKQLKNRFIKGDQGILDYVKELSEKLKAREKELESAKLRLVNSEIDSILKDRISIDGINLIKYKTDEQNIKVLKSLVDNIKQRSDMSIIIIVSVSDTSTVLCGITKDLTGRYDAKKVLDAVLASVSGKGGGRPDLAQGGFRGSENALLLYNSIENIVRGILI